MGLANSRQCSYDRPCMNLFVLLCIVIFGFNLVRAIRTEARRGASLALAAAWGIWALASLSKIDWIYLVGLGALLLSHYLNVAWPRRMLKELQRLAGLSDEDVARLEEASHERDKHLEESAKRKAEEKAAYEAFEAHYFIEARNRPVEGAITLEEKRSFPVLDGGLLNFTSGELTVRLCLEDLKASDEASVLQVAMFIRDEQSQVWRADSYVNWGDVLREVLDCPRGETGEGIHLWDDLPDSWMKTLRESCLITGATALLDSRGYYKLNLSDRVHTIREKYQCPEIDFAWSSTHPGFLVRVSQMYFVTDDGDGEVEDLPPIIFDLPLSKLVLAANPSSHWRHVGDWFEFGEEDRPLPTFFQVGDVEGLPPSRVTFVAA